MRKAFETLRQIRHIEWIALMLALGLGLLFLSGTLGGEPADIAADAPLAGSLEARMERTLSSIDGAGAVQVLLHRAEDADGETGEVIGALVVAGGADDLSVRLELMRAVQSLLGVPQKNIEVLPMIKENESEEIP